MFQTLNFVVNVLNVFQSTPLLLIMVHRWLKAIKVSFLQDLIFTYLQQYYIKLLLRPVSDVELSLQN